MHNVVCEQVKSLKIMHERTKDENESLMTSLRDIQSESFDKQKFGKLYYVVMLSRWQEVAVNKKYDMKLNECKELKGELLNANQALENKEDEHQNAEREVRKTQQLMLHLKQKLQSCKNMFLTIEQGEEFNRVINELTDERTRLEELYFKARSESSSALNMLDDAKIKAEEKEALLQDLRISKPSALSDKLIAMSETLQKLSLATRKAERNAQELEERENYLSTLLSNRTGEVTKLEETVARLEKDRHIKEEQWRRQDDDRMRRYFNKLNVDDDGGDHGRAQGGLSNNRGPAAAFQNARPHTSAGPQAYQTAAEKSAQGALHDEQLAKMATELARLKDEVSYKDSVIRKLQGWQEADAAVMGGEDGVADVMEEQRAKFQAVHDQESKEMADAAYQTIKTLNEMLEQKKVQLRAKEEHIDKLRQQMAEQRELAAE